MISWLRGLAQKRWTRRTTWTPLLLNQRQLQRVLSKERMRADRERSCFGLIILRVIDLHDVRGVSTKLAKLLHRRLRDTDEKGHLNYGRLGVVLPATNEAGTQIVLDEILRLASQAKLPIEGEAFVYPERPGRYDGSRTGAHTGSQNGSHSEQEVDSLGVVEDSRVSSYQPLRPSPATASVASVSPSLLAASYPGWKRGLDILGSLVGLAISLPIICVAALLIRLTNPGPAFFAQKRIGYLGQSFWIYKLRTMVVNAEAMQDELLERNERDGPAFKMRHDPRITRVGRILRSTGFDELPQLFNVLKGDMSLVGPRPLPVAEAEQCEGWQRARMYTKPGLTCYWQLAKSRKMSFVEWMRLDMKYARARNVWLDLKLILKTFTAVFMGRVGH